MVYSSKITKKFEICKYNKIVCNVIYITNVLVKKASGFKISAHALE